MADTATKLMPWQQDLINSWAQGRELKLMMSGRQTGKSQLNQLVQNLQRFANTTYDNPVRELILTEGRVYGARYYCIEPVGGDWVEMEAWCVRTFGPTADDGVWTPGMRWYMNNRKFWFREVKDRDWFLIKWQS